MYIYSNSNPKHSLLYMRITDNNHNHNNSTNANIIKNFIFTPGQSYKSDHNQDFRIDEQKRVDITTSATGRKEEESTTALNNNTSARLRGSMTFTLHGV